MDWQSPHAARRTIGADRIVDMLALGGWPFEWRAGQHDRVAQWATDALAGLLALGLPHDGPRDAPLFDPAEVPYFVMWAGLYRGDPTYERQVQVGRRLVWEPHAPGGDRTGPPRLADLPAQGHTLTIWRTFGLDAAPGTTVRLRLPAPLDGSGGTVLAAPGIVQHSRGGPARMEVSAIVPQGPFRVGVRMDVTDAPGLDTEREDIDLYLRPAEGLIHRGARIDALAAELAGPGRGIEAVRGFREYSFAHLQLAAMHADWLDPGAPLHTVLDSRRCDCRAASALLVALCRARGIPARIVNGYMLHRTAPGFHTWPEAWLDGAWHPFDLLDLTYGGRDPAWKQVFDGQIRQRLAIERLPHVFTGLGVLRMPGAWHMLTRLTEAGTEVQFRTIGTDRLIYADELVLGHQP